MHVIVVYKNVRIRNWLKCKIELDKHLLNGKRKINSNHEWVRRIPSKTNRR